MHLMIWLWRSTKSLWLRTEAWYMSHYTHHQSASVSHQWHQGEESLAELGDEMTMSHCMCHRWRLSPRIICMRWRLSPRIICIERHQTLTGTGLTHDSVQRQTQLQSERGTQINVDPLKSTAMQQPGDESFTIFAISLGDILCKRKYMYTQSVFGIQ